MKKCTKCDEVKPEAEFDFRNKEKGIRRASCKACVAADHLKRYESQERKDAIRENAKKRKQELVDKLWAYKNASKCFDCGERNPIVLEFDHLPEYEKSENISVMVTNLCSWERILKEIQKCEVVCANCHRIRTHMRAGWIRNRTVCG